MAKLASPIGLSAQIAQPARGIGANYEASAAPGPARHRGASRSMRILILILSMLLAGCDTIRQWPSSSPTDPNCPPSEVRFYLRQVNEASSRLTALANRFQNTNSPQETPPIIRETEALFVEVMLWKPPQCVQELQIDLSMAIANVAAAMQAIVDGDMNAYNRKHGVYQIALTKLNQEYQRLSSLVGP